MKRDNQLEDDILRDLSGNLEKDKSPRQTGRCHCKRNAPALKKQKSSQQKSQRISMLCVMNIYDWLIMV